MRLRSTRGGEEVGLLEAVDRGIAPDGGLYVPVTLPSIASPPDALSRDFDATAGWAMRGLLGDSIPLDVTDRIVRAAMNFRVPVETLPEGVAGRADVRLLDLGCGPTRAFKDVGARFLAALWALHPTDADRTVLVATSGDTGGAVADACHGLPGLRAVVLFPEGRVTPIQRRQFTTLGDNVLAVGVDGPFDRCQALVKAAFADEALRTDLGLTSANSINIGRLLPQLLPYLHLARLDGWGTREVRPGTVVVPSGNLGNLWAALVAKAAGAPIGRIVAACNRNDTLVHWLADPSITERRVAETPSSAMDVGRPSNLERIATLLKERPDVRPTAVAIDDDATRDRLRTAAEAGRTVDPHTAVGLEAAARLGSDLPGPVTVVETAAAAKFPEVLESAGVRPVRDPILDARLDLPEHVVRLPVDGSLSAILRAWVK